MTSAETGTPPLVLYVDDEPGNRVVFQRSLGEDFRIEVAASAEEALQKMAVETPAVIVTDQRMPGMSGTALLAEVKRRWPDTVRIILTAYDDAAPMLEVINRQLDANQYLVKPWDRREMMAILRGALETHRLQAQIRALELSLFTDHRLSALGLLTSSVAHEMASPLSSMVNEVETLASIAARVVRLGEPLTALLDADEHELPRDLSEIATDFRASVQYLTTLVTGLRDQARPDDGDGQADPGAVIFFVGRILRGSLSESRLTLETEQPGSLPRVRISPISLCQVLVNLISNARDAFDGRSSDRRIVLAARLEDRKVHVEVVDHGCGIEPERVATLGRQQLTTKPVGEGTGLGLVICRQLLARVGTELEIHSELGKGTRVGFQLDVV